MITIEGLLSQWLTLGFQEAKTLEQDKERKSMSNVAQLSFCTWNCGGLSKVKNNLTCQMGYDFVCLTETHSCRDTDPLTTYSEPPSKSDSWSGVALRMSARISKYIMNTSTRLRMIKIYF